MTNDTPFLRLCNSLNHITMFALNLVFSRIANETKRRSAVIPILLPQFFQIQCFLAVHYNHNLNTQQKNTKMIPSTLYCYPFNQYFPYSLFEYASPLQNFSFQYNLQNFAPALNTSELNEKKRSMKEAKEDSSHTQTQVDSSLGKKLAKKNHQILKKSAFAKISTEKEKSNINNEEEKLKNQSQKDGRNANSNLLRMFFRRLDQKIQSSPSLTNNIITLNKMRITQTKFEQWFEINRVEYKNYIRLPSVRKLFIGNKSTKNYTKIMRILLEDFLKNDAHCFYLTSKKIKKSMMSCNYRSIRTILNDIIESSNDI